ncbi:MAG: aminoacyl-histidine dipeptidase [Muribaculaceae bacterium]|nr:aminoacyl-histidine dipeptidase [Muribaculaceae bacterium]
MTIKDLQPAEVFGIFHEITQVPRPSKKEGKIRKYLLDFAAKHNLEVQTDEIGNVVMRKPATPGHEDAPGIIMQAHMDMVCESNHKGFDFENQPITTIVDGDWLHADGTTLGADNGIGMAGALAALTNDKLVHGPLEALFTVDEETGLTGANNLGPDMIHGQMLLNLDSEDDAEIFVGCAGGIDTTCLFTYERSMAPTDFHYFKFEIANGLGGHSGSDIKLGRANAVQLLARFLWNVGSQFDLSLCEIDGGNLRNAIPRASHAIFGVHTSNKEKIVVAFNQLKAEVENEYAGIEPNITLSLETIERPEFAVDSKTTKDLVEALYACPHGVISMSRDIEGLVETSTNLASVKMQPDNHILAVTSQRSSVESRKFDLAHRIEALFTLAGAKVTHGDGYPGWAPNMKSKIMQVASDAYYELYGIRPAIKAIHAGLECGLFLTKYPGLDMVSFGPTLRDVHSPSESMNIPAVDRFWHQLCRTIEKVADLKK